MNVNYEQKIDGLIRGWERDHIQHDWTSALGQLGNVGTSEWPIIRDTYTRVRKNIVAENVSLSVSETATVPVPETAVAVAQPESQPSAKSEPVIESDPFVFTDADRAEFLKAERPELGLIPSVRAAIDKGFHVFALTLKDKVPLPGSNGFKDSKSPSDPLAMAPWDQDPSRNIGIDLGASDLCVLDFDQLESIPAWLNELRTYKVKTARGVHVYFRGARPTTKLFVNGVKVGDIKSQGGYVLAENSVHPSGAIYTVIDDSPIATLPDISGLIRHESERVNASVDGPPIPYGSHDTELTRIAGVYRSTGLSAAEIEPLLVAICDRRCENHGSDYREMCHKIAHSIGKKPVEAPAPPVMYEGRPMGQPQTSSAPDITDWLSRFRSVQEMEDGPIVMVINGALQEGICFIGADPGDGKTLVALAMAKAIATGTPLFGLEQFAVPHPRTVIYLIPETRDRAFRKRCEAFRMPTDKMKFMARTMSSGASLDLADPYLLQAVRETKPVVFLDTAARFMKSNDENSAAQNRLLVNDVISLLTAGAVAVVLIHHAKKDDGSKRKRKMTLQNMLRGSTDIAAMCDQAYGLQMDHAVRENGAGPMEIELVDLKDREDVGTLSSLRLAASYKKAGSIFPVSYINETGNFRVVKDTEQMAQMADRLERIVQAEPEITEVELVERTGATAYSIGRDLSRRGWHKAKGGPTGHSPWHKDGESGCPYAKARNSSSVKLERPHVNVN